MWQQTDSMAELIGAKRCDLTKEQRDQHIRRYAELLERQREVSRQIDAKPVSSPQGGRPKGVASQIAEETGLSKRTVERVPNPPAPRVVDLKPVQPAESEAEAIIREANAIVSAWNRARQDGMGVA